MYNHVLLKSMAESTKESEKSMITKTDKLIEELGSGQQNHCQFNTTNLRAELNLDL